MRDGTLAFGLPGNPVSAMVTFELFARPALAPSRAATPTRRARPRRSTIRCRATRSREQAIRVRLRHADGGLRATTTGEQGSHMLSSMLGADGLALIAPARASWPPASAWRSSCCEAARPAPAARAAPARPRARDDRPRAAVRLLGGRRDRERQAAEVTLPREELERIWSPEYLERLARTYWSFLSRFSLGVLRVLYGEDSREVVFLRRPFVLLRFRKPEYEINADGGTVTWPIDRGRAGGPKRGAGAASCG